MVKTGIGKEQLQATELEGEWGCTWKQKLALNSGCYSASPCRSLGLFGRHPIGVIYFDPRTALYLNAMMLVEIVGVGTILHDFVTKR